MTNQKTTTSPRPTQIVAGGAGLGATLLLALTAIGAADEAVPAAAPAPERELVIVVDGVEPRTRVAPPTTAAPATTVVPTTTLPTTTTSVAPTTTVAPAPTTTVPPTTTVVTESGGS